MQRKPRTSPVGRIVAISDGGPHTLDDGAVVQTHAVVKESGMRHRVVLDADGRVVLVIGDEPTDDIAACDVPPPPDDAAAVETAGHISGDSPPPAPVPELDAAIDRALRLHD